MYSSAGLLSPLAIINGHFLNHSVVSVVVIRLYRSDVRCQALLRVKRKEGSQLFCSQTSIWKVRLEMPEQAWSREAVFALENACL